MAEGHLNVPGPKQLVDGHDGLAGPRVDPIHALAPALHNAVRAPLELVVHRSTHALLQLCQQHGKAHTRCAELSELATTTTPPRPPTTTHTNPYLQQPNFDAAAR